MGDTAMINLLYMKTKKLTFLLALTFLFLLLTGFSLGGFVDNVRFKGTSVGVTKCVERNKQEGVPHQLIKSRCVDENQKKLEKNVVTGSAGYDSIKTRSYTSSIMDKLGYEKYCVNGKNSSNLEISDRDIGTGYGSCYVTTWTGKSTYSGTIENKTNDKIITSFEIHVSHDDNIDSSGKKITEIIPFETWWILPNQSKEFKTFELKFHPKRDRLYEGEGDSRKFFSSFSFQNVKGIDFILK
jgi:hypothetical protein